MYTVELIDNSLPAAADSDSGFIEYQNPVVIPSAELINVKYTIKPNNAIVINVYSEWLHKIIYKENYYNNNNDDNKDKVGAFDFNKLLVEKCGDVPNYKQVFVQVAKYKNNNDKLAAQLNLLQEVKDFIIVHFFLLIE